MEKVGMALRGLVLSLGIIASVMMVAPVSATTFNGSFEGANTTEAFDGWTVSADAFLFGDLFRKTKANTSQGVTLFPTDGSSMAYFESWDPLTSISVVLPGPGVVSFDVAFTSNSNDIGILDINNRARATLGNEILFEATTFGVGIGGNGGGNFIDWQSITAQVPVGGAVLMFSEEVLSGVGIPSNFLVDNVRFTPAAPVPLPASLPLFAVACGIAGIRKRFRK